MTTTANQYTQYDSAQIMIVDDSLTILHTIGTMLKIEWFFQHFANSLFSGRQTEREA